MFLKKIFQKKNVYDKIVEKVNNIDTRGFVLKTKYDIDKLELDNKIPDSSNLVKKTDYNSKVSELENKIHAAENKISDVSTLVEKTDYKTKISELETKRTDHNHDKYITALDFQANSRKSAKKSANIWFKLFHRQK